MNWQLLGISFLTVFLAEIGDKSQLAAIALGGSSAHPRMVFFGTVVALVLASFLGILVGEGVAQVFPTRLVKAIAALGFLIMGIRLLLPKPVAIELPIELAKE